MSAAEALGLPPGVRFDPTPEELLEFYLVPRALGWPTAVPGIIIEDAAATTSSRHPWKLLKRHRRTKDDEAYFFERIANSDAAKVGARQQDRSCGGGGWKWVGQRRHRDAVVPLHGRQVSWGHYSLNLQEVEKDGSKGGSTGWVMHEYTIASPECPYPVKVCHVAFSGHGQKRQRVPPGDDDDDGEDEEAGPPQHKRAATASSVITTATPDQELRFPNYEASSVAHFMGSDAGFSQESSVLDPCYPDVGSSHQEPFAMPIDHELTWNQECFSIQPQQVYHQEQFMNHVAPSVEAYCAPLQAPGLRSSLSQEPPPGQPLTKEQQLRLQLAQFIGGDISTPHCPPIAPINGGAAYHEEQHIQTMVPAATADLPLLMDQESCTTEQSHGDMDDQDDFFAALGCDLNTFCDTTGVQDYDDMAWGTLAGDGHGDGTS